MKIGVLRRASWEDKPESALRLLEQARETGEDLLYQLNRYVRRNPWKAVAAAMGAGLVLGALVLRNGKEYLP